MAKMDAKPMVRPLFAQIEELITARIVAGEWKPGEPLPSESEFAAHYNVSQGTVRKAISQMDRGPSCRAVSGQGHLCRQPDDGT